MSLKKVILITLSPFVLILITVEWGVHDPFSFSRCVWHMDRRLELLLIDPDRVSPGMLDDIINRHESLKRTFPGPRFGILLDQRIGDIYLKVGRVDEAFASFQAAVRKARTEGWNEMEAGLLFKAFEQTVDDDFERAQEEFYHPLVLRFPTHAYGLKAPWLRLKAVVARDLRPDVRDAFFADTVNHYQTIITNSVQESVRTTASRYLAETLAITGRYDEAVPVMIEAFERSAALAFSMEKRRLILKRLMSWAMLKPSLSHKMRRWIKDYAGRHPGDPLLGELWIIRNALSSLEAKNNQSDRLKGERSDVLSTTGSVTAGQ